MLYRVYFGVVYNYFYCSLLAICGRYVLTEKGRFGYKTGLTPPLLLTSLYQAWNVSGHVYVC